MLINNAGLTRDNLALRMKDEDWQTVLEVNLTAVFRLIRAALRGMMRRRWGRIVNVTSIVAQSRAGELCRGQSRHDRHDQIAGGRGGEPRYHGQLRGAGFIQTPMTAALSEDQGAASWRVPVGRLGNPPMSLPQSAIWPARKLPT